MENPKLNSTYKDKISFLVKTYVITIVLWFSIVYLAAFSTGFLKDNSFIQLVANFDIFKLVVLFILFFFIGRYLDKLPKAFHIPVLILRTFMMALVICCANMRWQINPETSAYYNYAYKIIVVMAIAQALRLALLYATENFGGVFKTIQNVVRYATITAVVGLLIYFYFTLSERMGRNTRVETIDLQIWDYIKYPLLLLLFMDDYAFGESTPSARRPAYHLYYVKISEYFKASGLRLSFLTVVYIFIAGVLISEGMLRNT